MLAVGDIVVTPAGRSAEPASTAEPQAEHAEHVLAWHFVGQTLRDGSAIPPDGVVLRHDGSLVICESGLHASERPIDALQYAPGETLCRVRCAGQLVHDTDKLICTERTILWRIVMLLSRAIASDSASSFYKKRLRKATKREIIDAGLRGVGCYYPES